MKFGKRKAIYPIHGYSLGYLDTPREPLTWFRCTICGTTTIGTPYEKPTHRKFMCHLGEPSHESEWEPMDSLGAGKALREIESEEIARRVENPRP